ncbi:MAG: glycosyltransferase, partial [Deltaproteobacteria bacterium]|nr:glycosyltransferase [Deltaproteobacteria bacterium]
MKSDQPSRQVLQRVVLSGPAGAELLYLRPQENSPTIGTDTYVNLFHKSHWQHLTGLSDFGLNINSRHPGQVRIFSLSGCLGEKKLLAQDRLVGGNEPKYFELSPEADFFYFDWTPDRSSAPLPAAEYTAEFKPAATEPHIALVITTFSRIEALQQLVATYNQARQNFLEIKSLTHLYVINNRLEDADRLADLTSEGITLLNNPVNSGGAGGFGLGAREAAATGLYSHVLFMDDDVIIHPEAWLRTLALIGNLKPLYADQLISGGMLNQKQLTHCHTLAEALDHKVKHINLIGDLDLADIVQTRKALSAAEPDWGYPQAAILPAQASLRPYAAWWYCLIPAELFKKYGYPLPLFFRGDDQEFGLRLKRKVLTLNGIFVWHPSFESSGKTTLLRSYLGTRNQDIYTTLHFKHWRKLISLRFIRALNRSLAANDYEKAAVMILAFTDYMTFGRRTPLTGAEL